MYLDDLSSPELRSVEEAVFDSFSSEQNHYFMLAHQNDARKVCLQYAFYRPLRPRIFVQVPIYDHQKAQIL